MPVDGSLIFDTGLDNSGFTKNLGALTTAATAAAATITTAFTAASAAAVNVGMNFESSMSQVAATMGITSAAAEFEILSQAAKDMGESTKFSASQAGEALNYLALAGYDAEKSVAALPTVLNVAAAGGMELASASDMITDAMSALGLETAQMATFANQLAVTAQKSNTSVSQLGEAILTVGGTAKSLSGGVVEMNTALGILADNGIKGAEGGTALRNVILSLSAPTDTAAEALDRLGVTAFDASGTMRPLEDTFADLDAALSKLSDQDKNAVLNDIFNKVDLKSVNALLGTSSERFDQLSGYIADCEGAAADMAKTMDDNLKGDLTIMQSALEGAGIAAYEKFQVPMRTAVQEVTASIGDLTASLTDGELSDSMDKVASAFSDVASNALKVLSNDVLPAVVQGFALIVDHGEKIINVAIGIGTAFAAWKVAAIVTKVVSSFQTANLQLAMLAAQSGSAAVAQTALAGGLSLTEIAAGLFTGKITLATAAQSAFNKVVLANPIGILLTAFALATAAAVGFSNTINEMADEIEIAAPVQAFVAKTNAATEAIRQQREEFEKLKESQKEKEAADNAEINNIQRLWGELQNYVDESGNVISNNERASEIIGLLNENYDMNIEYIGNQIQGYSELANSMDDYIEKLRMEARIRNNQPVYDEAIKNLDELQSKYDELEKQEEEKLKAFTVAGEKYASTGEESFLSAQGAFAEQIGAIRNQKEELKTQMSEYQKVADEYEGLFSKDNNSSDAPTNGAAIAAQAYGETMTKINQENAEKLAEQQKENTEKMQKAWEDAEYAYSTGVIASEQELYEKKREIWNKYGDSSVRDHRKYYTELCEYDKDFAKQVSEAEEQVIRDKWDNINRLNQMGLLTDAEAMAERKKFLEEYYPEYSAESHEYYKQIYDDENKIAAESLAEQEDIVDDGLTAIVKRYQEAYKELDRKRQEYRNKLLSVGGDLFSVDVTEKNGKKTTTYTVNNLDEQLRKMREYHRQVKALKEQNASEGLLSELTSMGTEDSMQFAKYLSGMSAAEFAKINDLYNEKQKLADDLSQDLYKSEAQSISESMTGALADLATSAYDYGAQTAQQFTAGFNAAMDELGVGVLFNQIQASGATKTYENYVVGGTQSGTQDLTISVDVTGKSNVYLDGKLVGESYTEYKGKEDRKKGT